MIVQKNKQIQKIESAYNNLEKIGKIGVIAGLILFIFFIWFMLQKNFLTGTLTFDAVKKEVQMLRHETNALQKKIQEKSEQSLMDEEKNKNEELKQVKNEMAQSTKQLITSEQLYAGLKALLRENPDLQLSVLENFPLQKMKETAPIFIYRSPFEMTIDGNFSELVSYLQKVEKHYPFIFWDEMTYQALKYPDAKMTVKFHIFILRLEEQNEISH